VISLSLRQEQRRVGKQCCGASAPLRAARRNAATLTFAVAEFSRQEDDRRQFASAKADAKREADMTVKAILSNKGDQVLTIEPNATLTAAVQTLTQRRIGALVVTGAGGRLAGIISERDVVRALAEKGADALAAPVSEVMTRKVVTCRWGDTIAQIMELMTSGKFRHVPVVEQDQLAGIISIGDVVKARLGELEREQDALRDYIRSA
jgi:CBS domain-containing protein